jgi:Na+/H+ antiporter NhaD/arsenite permease-like protein
MWALAVAVLLAIFMVMDIRAHRGQPRDAHDSDDLGPAISIYGASNLLLVFAVLAGVLIHDPFNDWLAELHLPRIPLRELIMTGAISISLWTTPRRIHVENVFNFAPIREVAFLFIGIFATMVPALNYLA